MPIVGFHVASSQDRGGLLHSQVVTVVKLDRRFATPGAVATLDQRGPLKVRRRVSAVTVRLGPSLRLRAQPSCTCSKTGGGPSMIVILSSIVFPIAAV